MHAIYFSPPQSGAPGEVFGIDIAILNFVRNYCRYTQQEQINVVAGHPDAFSLFQQLATEAGIDPARCINLATPQNLSQLNNIKTMFHADPNINNYAWHRANMPQPAYALCGLTHTMTGSAPAGVVSDYLTSPTQIGDALICPSRAIKAAIERLFGLYGEYLGHRFKTVEPVGCPVDLPIIPLAIETQSYIKKADPAHRATQRAALDIAEDEVLILYFGRLSYYTKSHPLPTLLAVERAAQRTTQKLRLVMMGFFSPPELEAEYKALAADICPSVRVDFISKDDPRFPNGLWAAADIFTSLVDNHQESFGLTPIEGMAAGLPCVITDWDGYRDGVRHGLDGFLVPTIAPGDWMGYDIAYRYYNGALSYSEYLATAAQSVAIDIDFAAASFALLAENPEKRRQMGAAGRRRAIEVYDWQHIIPQYEALWGEQAIKRRQFASSPVPSGWPAVHRAYPDPYAMFGSFPSAYLYLETRLSLSTDAAIIEKTLKHKMNYFNPGVLHPLDKLIDVLAWLGDHPGATIRQIQEQLGANVHQPDVIRSMGWLLKNGFVTLTDPLQPLDHRY